MSSRSTLRLAALASLVVLALSGAGAARAGSTQSYPWRCGKASAKLIRVRAFVPRGSKTTTSAFARGFMETLCDSSSWVASGKVRYRYDPQGTTVIKLLSPAATEKRCKQLIGLSVHSYYSCASRAHKEAVLNSDRWFKGSSRWPGSVAQYRRMLVNHEVGHLLGQHHRSCSRSGAKAPVMMQQSKGLKGCRINFWPLAYERRALAP